MRHTQQLLTKWKYALRQLNRIEPNIIYFVYYGLLYDIVLNMYKPFAVKFLERLGGGDFYISMYNSLPGLVAIFALIPGSMFISRFKKKKNVTSAFFIASRMLILVLVIIPFLERSLQPLMFVLVMGIMNFPDSISQMSLQSFLGENMAGQNRAQAISLRTKFGQVTTLLVTFASGLIIRFAAKTDEQTIVVYQVFFLAAFAVSVFEILAFRRLREKEKPVVQTVRPNFREIFAVFKDKKYTSFLVQTLAYYFTWQLAWPAIGAFQVLQLGADEVWFALFSVASGVAAYFGASYWGKQVIKKGNDRILFIAMLLVAGNMVGYVLSYNLWAIIIVNVYGGFVGASISITLFNGLLEATPDKNRVIYIAVYNTLINVSLAISAFVCYFMMSLMSYRMVFLIDSLLRAGVGFLVYLNYKKKRA